MSDSPDDFALRGGLEGYLSSELESSDPQHRLEAVKLLTPLAFDSGEAAAAIRKALEDGDPEVRRAAAGALETIRQEEARRKAREEELRRSRELADQKAREEELRRAEERQKVRKARRRRADALADVATTAHWLAEAREPAGTASPGESEGAGRTQEELHRRQNVKMRPLEELEEFFRTQLVASLAPLEKRRKAIAIPLRVLTVTVVVLVIIVALVGLLGSAGGIFAMIFVVASLGLPAAVVVLIVRHLTWKPLKAAFKDKVFRRLVEFANPQLRYYPDKHVSWLDVEDSRLFQYTSVDYCEGEDLVRGTLGGTNIELSEVRVARESNNPNGGPSPVFNGLFFVADFNKRFGRTTVVVPDMAERLLGSWLGRLIQRVNIVYEGTLVQLEDPRFEKHFAVYADDETEARYILTPRMMELLCELRKRVKPRGKMRGNYYLLVSFANSKMYVAVPSMRNMFEPQLYRSLLDFKQVEDCYLDLVMLAGIVEEMKLNSRLWARSDELDFTAGEDPAATVADEADAEPEPRSRDPLSIKSSIMSLLLGWLCLAVCGQVKLLDWETALTLGHLWLFICPLGGMTLKAFVPACRALFGAVRGAGNARKVKSAMAGVTRFQCCLGCVIPLAVTVGIVYLLASRIWRRASTERTVAKLARACESFHERYKRFPHPGPNSRVWGLARIRCGDVSAELQGTGLAEINTDKTRFVTGMDTAGSTSGTAFMDAYGQPILFRVDPKTGDLVIWSCGRNGEDETNDGASPDPKKKPNTYYWYGKGDFGDDIVVRAEKPPPR